MNLPVIAIRPEPGCRATVAAGKSLGLEITPCPLFAVKPVQWDMPDLSGIDGVLLGSANAIRHGGPGLSRLSGLPAYAVGAVTGEAAEAAGLVVVERGAGGLQSVLDRLDGRPLTLLRLAGAERVELSPPENVTILTRTVYETVPVQLAGEVADAMRRGALVLLHSAAAARHLAAECDRQEIPRNRVALAALGPRIAAAAGAGWLDVQSTFPPTDAALLALAREMCHDSLQK